MALARDELTGLDLEVAVPADASDATDAGNSPRTNAASAIIARALMCAVCDRAHAPYVRTTREALYCSEYTSTRILEMVLRTPTPGVQ